jgi:hypothetical protein
MRTPLQQVEQGYHPIERQRNSRNLNRHKQNHHKHLELCTLDEGQSMNDTISISSLSRLWL